MIADTWLLLMLRLQIGWNNFKSRKLLPKVLTVIGALWVGGVLVATSGVIGTFAGVLVSDNPDQHLEALLPGVILTAVTLLVLLTSFGTALGSLFLSSDLELLMSAPVNRRAVFASKLLDGMVWNYALLAATALPALISYGIAAQYGPLYYVAALLAVTGTPLLPVGLSAILVMLVARFAPARRVREVLGLFGALFGISCGLISQTSRLWGRQIFNSNGPATLESFLDGLRGVANLPIPSMVAGHGLAAAGVGDLLGAGAGLAGFFVLTFGLFGGCLLLAENLYASGWVRMQSSGSAKRSKERAVRAASHSGLLGKASASMAIVFKDWRVLPRDLRNFAQLFAPLVFIPIVYLNVLGGGRGSRNPFSSLTEHNGIDPTGIYVSAGVLAITVLFFARIAATSISMEGRSWWILKIAPITGLELLRGKLLASLIPFMALSTILMIAAELWKGFNLLWFFYGWLAVEVLGAGLLAIEIGFAVPWARLNWDDPRRMTSGWGSVFAWIAWIILGLIAGTLFLLPLLAQLFQPSLVAPAFLVGALAATAVTVGISWLVLAFGLSRLSSVGESS
ncbi:MAG: hypothetical protein IVW55_06290 [Chloroflexi bacterium]|nr:hypothetical protein [Chloroflexota bacterium]